MSLQFNKRESIELLKSLLIFLGSFTLLVSCASSGPNPTSNIENVLKQDSVAQQQIQELNNRLLASAQANPNSEDYTVREGDLLQVTVIGEDELSTVARVSAEGAITLPLVGAFKVEEFTVHELERAVEKAYGESYLQDPHVTIFVKEQQGGKITLLGAFAKPGTYDYFLSQPLLNALAMGGGLTQKAGTMVHVRRRSDDSERTSTFFIDLEDLIKKGEEQWNIKIEPGDVIFVPEAGTMYVHGAVQKPGPYPISGDMSVQEAIVTAGGLAWYSGDTVKLIRDNKYEKDIIELSANSVNVSNLAIRDKDIIFVEANALKQAVYGLRLTILGSGVAFTPPK